MKMLVAKNHEEAGVLVAGMIAETVRLNPNACLGLATGGSMEPVYAALVRLFENGKIRFDSVTTVNLDEYAGLPPSHPQSYRQYMNSRLFDHVKIDIRNTCIPLGTEPPEKICRDFQKFLDAHPRDLQLLGVGANGHIGFNEPGTFFESQAHIVTLNEQTREDNSRFFASIDDVPKQAVTMGVGDIMKASAIVILIHGSGKLRAVRELFTHERVIPEVPCTVLKLHRNATIVLTEDLARMAELTPDRA